MADGSFFLDGAAGTPEFVPAREPLALDPSLGQRLRYARVAAGMTGRGLARRAGLSATAISRIETGKQGALRATIERLAGVLRVGPAWLAFGPEGRSPQAGVSTPDQGSARVAAPPPASSLFNYREVNYV